MNATTARPGAGSNGPLVILTCSAIAMSLPGAVLAGPPGLLVAVLIALATLWCWTRTRPTPPPTRLGRRGAAWVQATAIAEGVVTTTSFIPLMMTGHIRWWLPLVLCSVSVHLTTFLVWARRRADLLLVPVSWAAVGLSAALTAVARRLGRGRLGDGRRGPRLRPRPGDARRKRPVRARQDGTGPHGGEEVRVSEQLIPLIIGLISRGNSR